MPESSEALEPAEAEYIRQLTGEVRALEQLTLVKGVNVYCNDDGSDPQKRGVSVTLDTQFLGRSIGAQWGR